MTESDRDQAYRAQRQEQALAALRLTPLERLQWLEQAKAFARLVVAARQGELDTRAGTVHAVQPSGG